MERDHLRTAAFSLFDVLGYLKDLEGLFVKSSPLRHKFANIC